MSNTYKTGDVVSLISGGPPMTISDHSIGGPLTYSCQWFDGSKCERGKFLADTLKLHKNDG